MVTILTNAAESNRAVLRYIPEVVWGTVPGSGVSKAMRITSSSLAATKETQQSQEIRADRMVPSIIEVAASTGGDVNFEASAGSQDDFYQQFLLMNGWTQPMNFFQVKGATVSVTDTDEITLTGRDWTDWLTVGQYIKLEGFLNVANNGYFEIAAVSFTGGNTVITTVETTLVAAAGSPFTKCLDANDVILKSTLTELAAANTIVGTGASGFAGKTLFIGQKIYLEGLGKETGTLTAGATDPAEGDTFVVNDGVQSVTFEIRTNSALVAPGNVHVALSGTEATLAASIAAAIMDQFRRQKIRCSATVSTAVVTVTNHRRTGGTLSENSAGLTVANFSGGAADKGGFFTIAALPDDDTIVTQETLGTDANAGGLTVVIKGSHLRNPGDPDEIVKQSISAETGFTDVDKYFTHSGLRVGTFSLSVAAGEIVTGSVSFMGRETLPYDVSQLGNESNYTVLDTTSTEVLNATANVGNVSKGGVEFSTAITGIEINGEANLREQRAVGARFPAGIGYGRFSMSGTITAYFNNFDLYNDFINHETVALAFNFSDLDHNTYYWTIPAAKFTADPISPEGIDSDVMEPIEWSAQRDPVLQTMLMIDRFSSVFPASVA